jgi:predicted metal-binding membrane protein
VVATAPGASRRRARRLTSGALATAGLVALAVGWAAATAPGGAHDHAHHLGHSGSAGDVGGWTVMVLAMMLPAALPLLAMLRRLFARRTAAPALLGAALVGYLAIWAAAGGVLVAGDTGLGRLSGGAADAAIPVAGGVLVVAGLFQFSSLKTACLTACRTPRWFALRYWRGRRPAVESAAIGAAYGVSCVGCCWALMLVSFAAGAAAMPAMVALMVVMAAERLTRWGRRIVRPVGVALTAVGVAVLVGLVPPALLHPLLGG